MLPLLSAAAHGREQARSGKAAEHSIKPCAHLHTPVVQDRSGGAASILFGFLACTLSCAVDFLHTKHSIGRVGLDKANENYQHTISHSRPLSSCTLFCMFLFQRRCFSGVKRKTIRIKGLPELTFSEWRGLLVFFFFALFFMCLLLPVTPHAPIVRQAENGVCVD